MFVLFDEEMNKIEFPRGTTPLDVFISSINKERIVGNVEGTDGHIDYGFNYKDRDIKLTLMLESINTMDYRVIRDYLYSFFLSHDRFYISEKYRPGKFYLVSVNQKFIPDRVPKNQRYAEATIICEKLELPFGESNITTNTFNTKNFRLTTDSDVPIHPFYQHLKITIENVVGSIDHLELINKTNGNTFRVNEKVTTNKIVLDGALVTSNGLQYLRHTNKKFIQLEKGWNDFELKGATSAKVTFEYKNYYL